jgi:hypothetical protein
VDRNKCEFLVVQVGLPSYVSLSVRFFIGHGVLSGTIPPKTLTGNMLRLVDKSLFMHALVAWIPVLFYETYGFNKHETMLS